MNNVAAAALVLPGALDVARRTGIKPSKLLIPVAYGSMLGGAATYFTTANIIVSNLLQTANPPQKPLNVFDFTPIGGLIAVTGILFLGLLGNLLLPDREPLQEQKKANCTGLEPVRNSELIQLEAIADGQPINKKNAFFTLAIILVAIGTSLTGVPVYLSMLAGALCVVAGGLVNMKEAYDAIEWQAIFLVAGMYGASLAILQTGLAARFGQILIEVVTPLGPLGLAGGAYLLTALLTQFMGGQVSALVTGPITISAAIHMGVNPQAVAVATAIGCSASFLTPMAHPVNVLMMGPANYKFGDFFRAGWLLTLISFGMLLLGLTLFWKL